MTEFAVILVFSTGHAIQAQRVLERAGVQTKLIPTPRALSSDCGSAIRIDATQQTAGQHALNEAGVVIDRILPY